MAKTHDALHALTSRDARVTAELDGIQAKLASAHDEAARRHDLILDTLRSAPTSAPDFGALRRDLKDAHDHAARQRERLLERVAGQGDALVARELERFERDAGARHAAVLERLEATPVVAPEALEALRVDVENLRKAAADDSAALALSHADVSGALQRSHAILAAKYEAMEAAMALKTRRESDGLRAAIDDLQASLRATHDAAAERHAALLDRMEAADAGGARAARAAEAAVVALREDFDRAKAATAARHEGLLAKLELQRTMLRNPSETSTEASTRQDRRRSSMQLLKADLAALKARTDDGDGRAGDVAAAVKDQLATYLADLRDEASGGDQDAAEVRAELRALQLSIAEMREESPRPDLPAEAPTPAMLEIQRELGHLSEQLKQAMPSPNTAHRRASFQVMKAELDQLKSAQRNAPDAAEMLKETMRDYVDQIRGDAAEGDREIIRAELGTLADRLSEVTAAQRELLSPRERAADPALLELSDQLAQLRRDMVTQQQQQRRPSSSSQRPSMVALREDVEALRSRHEAAPREALDAVRGDFQRFVEELRSDFTRTSTDERDAMRVEVAALHEKLQDMREDQLHSPRTEDAYDHLVEQFEALRADLQPKEPPKPRQSLARRSSLQLVKAELADLKRRKNSEHLSADALDAVQGNLKSYVDDLRRDMVASGDRDEMRGELHALQSQIAQLAASPRLAEAPVPSAASLEARIQPFLAEQLAPVLAELRKPPPVVQLQLPQQQTERPGRRSSLASVKADLAQLRHNQHDRVSKESIVRSVQSGLETYVKDLRADASAASDAERNGMREEIAVLQRALNDARADAAAQHAHSDHGAADHSALIAVQAKLDALSAEFRAPPAQARQHRRSSFSAMKRGLELLKRKRRVSDASPSASPLRSDASESERRCANQPPVWDVPTLNFSARSNRSRRAVFSHCARSRVETVEYAHFEYLISTQARWTRRGIRARASDTRTRASSASRWKP